jgi:hypothetical protein
MSMCPISIPSRIPQLKRGFMCAPGFSDFSNTACSAPNANSATSSVGTWNSTRIVKTMLTSIGTDSSPCQSLSLPGLLLPESRMRIPNFGWQFLESGLQLPDSEFLSPNPGLSSPLARVTLLASSLLLSLLLLSSSLANHSSHHVCFGLVMGRVAILANPVKPTVVTRIFFLV